MQIIKLFFNSLANPRLFFLMSVVALFLLIWQRERVAAKGFG